MSPPVRTAPPTQEDKKEEKVEVKTEEAEARKESKVQTDTLAHLAFTNSDLFQSTVLAFVPRYYSAFGLQREQNIQSN